MGKRGTLTVRVISDTKDGEKGLDRFASKAQTTGQRVEQAGRKMTVFATVPIAAAMGFAANAASDLNETLSKSNTVFGDSAKTVENWADTASDSFGQSKREALNAASSFGNLFVQLGVGADEASKMSMEMTELASDFASFHNADITEVIDAQTAAFRGEYDALQRFVPTINAATVEQKALTQTGKSLTSELTAQEKALAVQTLMLEGAGDAMGDFDRTSDSAANQMRTAKAAMEDASAELGGALLPIVAKTAGAVADLAGVFGDLPEPVQNGVLALAGLLAVSGPLMTIGGTIATRWAAARGALETAGIAALYAKDNFAKVAASGAALAAAGIAVQQAFAAWSRESQQATRDADAFADSFAGQFDPAKATYAELQAEIARLGGAADELQEHADNALNPFLDDRLKTARDNLRETAAPLEEMQEKADELQEQLGITADEALDLASDEEAMAAALDEGTGELDAQAAAAEAAAKEQEALRDSISEVTNAMKAQIDPFFAAQDALRRHKDAQAGVEAAQMEALVAQQNLDTAIREHGRQSDEAALKSLELATAQQKVKEAEDAVVRSAGDASAATYELRRQMEEGGLKIEEAEAQLRNWVAQGLLTEEQAAAAAGELRRMVDAAGEAEKRRINIPVDADVGPFERAIAQLYRERDGIRISVGGGGGIPLRHSGGPVAKNSMYLVGRPNHEELFVPDRDGQIISGTQTDQLLGRTGSRGGRVGGSNVVHSHVWNITTTNADRPDRIRLEHRRLQLQGM